jgi:hypothetical protein
MGTGSYASECAAREKQIMYNRASAFQRLGYATGATQPAHLDIHDSHTLSARAEMHFLRRGVRTGMSPPPRRNRIMQIARASRQSTLVCAVSGLDSCLVRKSAPKVSPNLATNSKSWMTIVFASKLSSEFSIS